MSTPPDFELGQRVSFSEHIRRTYVEAQWSDPNRVWTGEAYPGARNKGGEGIIVGKRTLSDGRYSYGNSDEPGEYQAIRYFTAYQIVTSLRTVPVHVLPEHITTLETK